jgi:hypothetical protein
VQVLLLKRLYEVGGFGEKAAFRELLRDAETGRFRERKISKIVAAERDEKLRVRVPHNPER